MSSVYTITKDAIATGTSLKTLLELQTGSTDRATLVSWWVEFKGTNSANAPILVQLARATAGITGTTITAVKYKDYAPASTLTVKHTASGEGTVGDILESHYVPPTSGLILQYPLGREPEIPISSFLRLQVTATADVNAAVGAVWEE